MASVLKVDKLDPQSGTALEIGSSGDTITIPSGATFTQSGTMNASAITAGTIDTARLGSGTASSSTVLYGDQTYKAEPGGGKLGQVIHSGTSPGNVVIDSVAFTPLTDGVTALAASITPAATSSSVLMIVNISQTLELYQGYGVSLRRAGTEFFASANNYDLYQSPGITYDSASRSSWFALDTGIATTSATEYTVWVKTYQSGDGDVKFNYGGNPSTVVLMEILA